MDGDRLLVTGAARQRNPLERNSAALLALRRDEERADERQNEPGLDEKGKVYQRG